MGETTSAHQDEATWHDGCSAKGMMFDSLSRRPKRPLTVLLAEDQNELRELIARELEADGALVTAVDDGLQAIAYLTADAPADVVVSDVRMPGRTGLDVLRELRRGGSRVPVVLITGFGQSVDLSEIAELGGAIVLEKPFDFDDLRTALLNLGAIARLSPRGGIQ